MWISDKIMFEFPTLFKLLETIVILKLRLENFILHNKTHIYMHVYSKWITKIHLLYTCM